MMARLAFLIIAGTAVTAALGLVLRRNVIHGALFLVVNLGAIAALYLMLGAEFLALAQIIVYAGAIMVLFVFAIMVLIPGKEETAPDLRRRWRLSGATVGVVLLVELVMLMVGRVAAPPAAPILGGTDNVSTIGRLLFTDYLLPFELTSVLLLAAMVGVVLLARSREGVAPLPDAPAEVSLRESAPARSTAPEASLR